MTADELNSRDMCAACSRTLRNTKTALVHEACTRAGGRAADVEREACARIAESVGNVHEAASEIAKRIRARGA